jgi:hypothetical protein
VNTRKGIADAFMSCREHKELPLLLGYREFRSDLAVWISFPSRLEKPGPNFYLKWADGFLRYVKAYEQSRAASIYSGVTSTWCEDSLHNNTR